MSIYQDNVRKHQDVVSDLSDKLSGLSTLRLIVFIFSCILIVVLANERLISALFIVVPICVLAFGLLVNRYNRLNFRKRHHAFLQDINEKEIARLENKFTSFPTGNSYISREHPYLADLDVFGTHSLFQLLNRTTTQSGEALLANWLEEPASDKDAILKRQQAIQELAPKMDWRQRFQAAGMHYEYKKTDYRQLIHWIEKPAELLNQRLKYLVAAVLLGILSTTAFIYFMVHVFSENFFPYLIPLIFVLVVNYFILKKLKPIVQSIQENVPNREVLGSYQLLIEEIETEKFEAVKLQELQKVFRESNYSASKEIYKLKRILDIVEETGNKLYPLFNLFWLVDIYWIILTEKWKEKNKAYLKIWATAVSEFEVLSSIAGFSYANPDFTFPKITEEPYRIHFDSLGHPLISAKSRVCNTFQLEGRGKIAMITGSNMAGKSTFLRTVGVNLVLALMGAPCCAKSGRVSSIKIFTSMRTQDNLEEGISSFYAELRRIEQLLKLIESGEPHFFLLDEMFKGTNSKDRHRGGFSLIRQLEELNAFGIISTHDLELASITGKHRMVANYSFNSEIQDGNLIFNYELTPGLCKDFNASELMKKSGIKVLPEIE